MVKSGSLTTFFLPYNPTIITFSSDPAITTKCAYWWPKGKLSDAQDIDSECDFLWIDSDGHELAILQNREDLVQKAKVIYTTTHFFKQGTYYQKLKFLLELNGFTLLSHWYWEGQQGNAIFVKKNRFEAAMRSLNYVPHGVAAPSNPSLAWNMQRFFQPATGKSSHHNFDQIDFIYMINLDERPEKFALAAGGLAPFGIYPYRFSAVNGWKLSPTTLNQVGVQFHSETPRENFLATVYREIDGRDYVSNELIQENNTNYFSLGMSRGAIGIVLSHLSVLQDAYDSGYNTIWVMEDDQEAVADPRQIPELIRKLDRLEEWDILFYRHRYKR